MALASQSGVDVRAGRADAGLTEAEAARRLRDEGPNELPSERAPTLARTVLDVAREPMLALLLAAGALYLLLGEPADAAALVGFVVVVVTITIVQERRTERALGALRQLSSPRARVVREGRTRHVPGREVVRGDVVLLGEGDRVPADGLLVDATALSADESLLTGESVPVTKRADRSAAELEPPGGDDRASVFAGTLVTAGHGVARVVATGPRSELGRIGGVLGGIRVEPTRLQSDARRVVRWAAVLGLTLATAVVVVYATTRGGSWTAWKEGALAGVAAAMSLLPEEFAVILAVYLAIGAWRLARENVLVRRLPAVEALGETTVLCVDKTGTLTENRMELAALSVGGRDLDARADAAPSAEHAALLAVAARASRSDGFDPMDRAVHAAAVRGGVVTAPGELAHEIPFTPDVPAVTRAWRLASGELEIACKGAPEAIATRCGLGAAERAELLAETERFAARGKRVLGVARGTLAPGDPAGRARHARLELVGLLAFEDPLRASAAGAVASCARAGIRVVMITGDHPTTARAVATSAGLPMAERVLEGAAIAALGDEELASAVERTGVFARVVPQHKLRIIRALQSRGEVVAMTGDGVNDAPALRAADVGVAMGSRGTDVAREAAAIVLLDDDLASIVSAIRAGRRTYDNIRKAMTFVVAVHVPIAALTLGQALVPSAALFLLPVHLAFLELVIDPACSLVFEAEPAEPRILERPPRAQSEALLSARTIALGAAQGLVALVATGAVLLVAHRTRSADVARTLAFATLVAAFAGLVLANRAAPGASEPKRANRTSAWLIAAAFALLAFAVFVPGARRLFRFAPLGWLDVALVLAVGVACLGAVHAVKRLLAPRASVRTSQPST